MKCALLAIGALALAAGVLALVSAEKSVAGQIPCNDLLVIDRCLDSTSGVDEFRPCPNGQREVFALRDCAGRLTYSIEPYLDYRQQQRR